MPVDDLISEYMDLISKEAGKDHNLYTLEMAAIMLLSATIGKKAFIYSEADKGIFIRENIHGTNFGPTAKLGIYLNVWMFVVAPSRLGRKTSITRDLRSYFELNHSDLLLPDMSTPEALVDELSKTCSTHEYSRGVWINDEVTTFFKLIKSGSYNSSADTIMSKFYDGDNYSRDTKKGGKVSVVAPYFNLWIGTTEAIGEFINPIIIKQGFMNRPFYSFGKIRQKGKTKKRKATQSQIDRTIEIEKWLNKWDGIVTHGCTMTFSKSGKTAMQQYEAKIERGLERLRGDDKLIQNYYGNLPNMVEKIAALYRVSRIPTSGIVPNAQGVIMAWISIAKEDVDKAVKFCYRSLLDYRKVIALMYESETPQSLRTDPMNALIIKSVRKHKKISKTKLLKDMPSGVKVDKNYIDAINTLLARGDMMCYKYKANPRDKTLTTFYIHKKVNFMPPPGAQKITHYV